MNNLLDRELEKICTKSRLTGANIALYDNEKFYVILAKKHYYDVSDSDREYSNYFHCEDPDCKGYIHIEKAIDVE